MTLMIERTAEEKVENVTNPIKTSNKDEDYIKRNALKWNKSLYQEIVKSVTMYYSSHKFEMDKYRVELEDLIQKVAFTFYRWKDFDPEAYGKKISAYTYYIINQKLIKDKRDYFKARKNISVSMDEEFSNQSSKDSSETTIADTVADNSYRFLEFVEECLEKIPADHKFYIDDVCFITRDVFRLLFNNYSGEEIAYAAGVDGKKFRKMKRTLTKEFYSADMADLWNSLPSNVTFKADYFIPYSPEETLENRIKEEKLIEELSSPVKISYIK